MQHKREPHEYSQIVRTFSGRGLKVCKVFYDTDIFVDDMKISVSLLSDASSKSTFELDVPEITHYNTIHLPENDLYGDKSGIILHAVPKLTSILGMKFPLVDSTSHYFISEEYDVDNEYTYEWAIVTGDAQVLIGDTKNTQIKFTKEETVVISCTITNIFGGVRRVYKSVQVGSQPKKIMVVRKPTK